MKGIEPSYEAWEAAVLPLNYTRTSRILAPGPRSGAPSMRAWTVNAPLRALGSLDVAAHRHQPIEPDLAHKATDQVADFDGSVPTRLTWTPSPWARGLCGVDLPHRRGVLHGLRGGGHNRRPMDEVPTPPAPPAAPPRMPIRSFVLRAGRMGSGQVRALAEWGPRFVLPYAPRALDFGEVFGRQAPRVLEIGFGMGAATAEVAAAHPDTDFLGIEVHEPGVGALLKTIGERHLSNLRIVQHDAVQVLATMVPPGSLAGVHIWFPDPWHKKRHNKRRLIQAPFVGELSARLAPGGYLHCATDWQPAVRC